MAGLSSAAARALWTFRERAFRIDTCPARVPLLYQGPMGSELLVTTWPCSLERHPEGTPHATYARNGNGWNLMTTWADHTELAVS